eukprot:14368464-Alexandrium_andersonii.AAC.1
MPGEGPVPHRQARQLQGAGAGGGPKARRPARTEVRLPQRSWRRYGRSPGRLADAPGGTCLSGAKGRRRTSAVPQSKAWA